MDVNIHVCFFIDPSTFDRHHAFRRVYQVPNLILYMDSITDFTASSHFNGVRAHHNFFVCSRFIIV
jgi:hypothetical protein